MARRNDKLTVTHTQILCWAIQHQEDQRKEEEVKLERLLHTDAAPDLKASLRDTMQKSIDRYDQVLTILRQMYEYETGTEF